MHQPAIPPGSVKWVPAKGRWCSAAGKVTVGLASHRPCITDFSGLSTYGLTALEREMSTPPTLCRSMVPLYLYMLSDLLPVRLKWCCRNFSIIIIIIIVIKTLLMLAWLIYCTWCKWHNYCTVFRRELLVQKYPSGRLPTLNVMPYSMLWEVCII